LETKEQFSDGVDMVGLINKEVVAVEVTDEQLASAKSVSVADASL
jgi:hypothetical protein